MVANFKSRRPLAKSETLRADFGRLSYYDEQSGFTVGTTATGQSICGECSSEARLVSGLPYEFYGRWVTHPQYGRQFRFEYFVQQTPLSRNEVGIYLAKYCHGIGPKLANRLFDAYGDKTLSIMRAYPRRVAREVKGITPEIAEHAAKSLAGMVDTEESRARLMQMFSEAKIPLSCIDEVIQCLGGGAANKLTDRPYLLLDYRIKRVGFATADKLYLDLGKDPLSAERQMRCLAYIIESDRSGSTWLPIEGVKTQFYQHMRSASVDFTQAIEACELAEYISRDGDYVASTMESLFETTIAQHFARLLRKPIKNRVTPIKQREYRPNAGRRRIRHE